MRFEGVDASFLKILNLDNGLTLLRIDSIGLEFEYRAFGFGDG